jgi:hypothetical protein
MSTKSHFIYKSFIQGYTDCSEQNGSDYIDNAYIIIDKKSIGLVEIKRNILKVKINFFAIIKINVDCLIDLEIDSEDVCLHLNGKKQSVIDLINELKVIQ